jgi:glycosyltransferase involved in cell wall biosynthesis
VLISVIIPCYNQTKTISLLLSSLEAQTLGKNDFEVIVADDASTDGSADILRNYNGPLHLTTIFAEKNGGRARARNIAASKAAGRFLLFLDGDMTASAVLLQEHLRNQQKTANLVCLGKMVPAPAFESDMLSWYRISRGAQKIRAGNPLPAEYFATGNVSLPAALFKKAGPFNESYQGWGGEDIEMGYQLANAGARFVMAESAVSCHHHQETVDGHIRKIKEYGRSGFRKLMGNCPAFAGKGYVRLFSSGNLFIRMLLGILFLKPFYAAVLFSVSCVKFKPLAYRLYDYLSYRTLYHALKEPPHA